MNFLLIWLGVSLVSTLFVLVNLWFAPIVDDEPLNITSADDSINKQRSAAPERHEPAVPERYETECGLRQSASRRVHSIPKRASNSPMTKFPNFSISRSEEPQA